MRFSNNVGKWSNSVSGAYYLLKMVTAASAINSDNNSTNNNWKSEVTPLREPNLTRNILLCRLYGLSLSITTAGEDVEQRELSSTVSRNGRG